MNLQVAPKLLALGSPALNEEEWAWPCTTPTPVGAGGGLQVSGDSTEPGLKKASTALLTRLHMDPGELLLPASLTSPKPLLGWLSPMAAGRVGTGRATAAPRLLAEEASLC